ncbi:MAG TPA: sterol desaturase family protein [Kofleriaceae bacterium]|nr:sterol desaturase family protein [Kofleriaceae bacterium]
MTAIIPALMQLGFLAAVLGALQWCFPNRPEQPVLREQWHTDLLFFFGQHLIWLGLQLTALIALGGLVDGVLPAGVHAGFQAQPFAAQAAELVLAGDLLVYWYHRLSHAVPLLWSFHRVHHSAPHLDWLAAHREHPIDGMLTQIAMNLPAMLLGVGLAGIAGLIVFRGLWAAFIHSNVRLPIGPLRMLIGAPELHHFHHKSTERTAHNFANLAPWTDLVFGTYHCPPHPQFTVGLPERPRRSYLGWLLRPHR